MTMRRELLGILLFFLVLFALISLLSYDPQDPSINSAGPSAHIHNLFGVVGAYTSGLFIGLFGLGAFWLPVILLFSSIHFFSSGSNHRIVLTFAGGLALVIFTGSLLAVGSNHYILFGQKYTSGGMVGIPLKTIVITYAGKTGGVIILSILWLVGFVVSTGFSLLAFGKKCWFWMQCLVDRIKTLYGKWAEKRSRAKKRKQNIATAKQKKKKIKIQAPAPAPVAKSAIKPVQEVFEFMRSEKGFRLPSVEFLENPDARTSSTSDENLHVQSRLVEKKLEDFGVKGQVVTVTPGPVITTFEYEPAPGVKINKIVSLTDDLALALRAISIRIVAPIPGKSVIGIEVPNAERETVRFKELVISDSFSKSKSKLTLCLGKDIVGNPVVSELERMPHLLIAGATGAGKSVALNTMICSFLYKAYPDEVKLIMVDPKRIELSQYDGIPHLITPVVTDVKKATNALMWAVREMERRYELLSEHRVRNIKQFNAKIDKMKPEPEKELPEKLPFIVIIIDELADLMMTASRDVETCLMRLAQMARAAGLHLMLATQRPSVDVLTGVIKANFPTRLSFQVSSRTDSRTIIDTGGAEQLLGNGDMLFLPPGTAKLQRIHGAYISETELVRIIDFLKQQKTPEYDKAVVEAPPEKTTESGDKEYDEKYDEAIALVTQSRQASISMIQRHLRIGYNRAARIIEVMEEEGIVGPSDGAKPREVLVQGYDEMP